MINVKAALPSTIITIVNNDKYSKGMGGDVDNDDEIICQSIPAWKSSRCHVQVDEHSTNFSFPAPVSLENIFPRY